MRNTFYHLSFLSLLLCSCQDEYQHLPEKATYNEELLKAIIPAKNIQYWQLEHFPNNEENSNFNKILITKGTYNKNIIDKPPQHEDDWNGFFRGCMPSYCAYRITYLENNQWKVVTSEPQLKLFIGKIDNVFEALLIATTEGYDTDSESEHGNGYIETGTGFILKVMKYKNCPESKESFTMFVDQNGNISNIRSRGYYLRTDGCIIY